MNISIFAMRIIYNDMIVVPHREASLSPAHNPISVQVIYFQPVLVIEMEPTSVPVAASFSSHLVPSLSWDER